MKCTERVLDCLLCFAVIAAVSTFVTLVLLDGPAYYSVAVSRLDAAGSLADPAALFNLTVHIKNPSRLESKCVEMDATAVVSYNGVKVGEGAVPEFCARKKGESEVVVPVWPADGASPGELQIRRGAVVDVAVRIPRAEVGVGRHAYVYDRTLTCSVKVGGGLSPCKSELI